MKVIVTFIKGNIFRNIMWFFFYVTIFYVWCKCTDFLDICSYYLIYYYLVCLFWLYVKKGCLFVCII